MQNFNFALDLKEEGGYPVDSISVLYNKYQLTNFRECDLNISPFNLFTINMLFFGLIVNFKLKLISEILNIQLLMLSS